MCAKNILVNYLYDMMHFHLFLLAKILCSLDIITEEEDNKVLGVVETNL